MNRMLPKDELRDDCIDVFASGDNMNEPQTLCSIDIAAAAFQATFFDVPEVQGEKGFQLLREALSDQSAPLKTDEQ